MFAPLNATSGQSRAEHDREQHTGRDRQDDAHGLDARRRQDRKPNPDGGEIEIHPHFNRHRPQGAVELALEGQGFEYARQRIAHPADEGRAFAEIFPRQRRLVIVGARQSRQRRREHENGQDEHDPYAGIDPENPRPEIGDQILPHDQARGDKKAARHEQHVEAHFAERKSDPVEKELALGRKPQHRDAVREQDRHGRGKAKQGEVVVPPDGVFGEPHESPLKASWASTGPTRDARQGARRHSAARTGRSGWASRWTLRRSATMKAISIDCSALRRGSQ